MKTKEKNINHSMRYIQKKMAVLQSLDEKLHYNKRKRIIKMTKNDNEMRDSNDSWSQS